MAERSRREGAFDALRLLAAWLVFHSHQFALTGRPEPTVPGTGVSFGLAGVVVFFAVSGHLVAQSAVRRSVPDFVAARLLRIVPALAVCLVVTVTVAGFASRLDLQAYWAHPATVDYLRNLFLAVEPVRYLLPGVLEGRPNPSVNGSLWTLSYEWAFYALVACLAPFGRRAVLAGAAIALGFLIARGAWIAPLAATVRILGPLDAHYASLFAAVFFGAAALNYADRAMGNRIALALAGLALILRGEPVAGQVAALLALGAGAVAIGRTLSFDRHLRFGDISYGSYLYAFPIQQAAAAALEPFALAYLAALLGTVLASWLSWVLVERRCLAWRGALAAVRPAWRPLGSARRA